MDTDTIELDCPGCNEQLEIDAGFANGVCRCSHCGTLMTVPSDPTLERAEQLSRPDRPDAPGGMPSPVRPDAPAPVRADSPLDAASARDESRAGPGTQPPPAAAPGKTGAEPDDQVYVTASGKSVRVSRRSIPMARKRKRALVRASTAIVFLGVLGGLVAVCVLAIRLLTSPLADPADTNSGIGWEARQNPLRSAGYLHFLGIPLDSMVSIALDAGKSSTPWFDAMKDALARGLESANAGTEFQIVLWSPEAPKTIPPQGGMGSLDEATRKSILDALGAVEPGGQTKLVPAIEKALDQRPDQLIIVTSQALSEDDVARVEDMLMRRPVLRLDAVLLDQNSEALSALVRQNSGTFMSLPAKQLKRWLRE